MFLSSFLQKSPPWWPKLSRLSRTDSPADSMKETEYILGIPVVFNLRKKNSKSFHTYTPTFTHHNLYPPNIKLAFMTGGKKWGVFKSGASLFQTQSDSKDITWPFWKRLFWNLKIDTTLVFVSYIYSWQLHSIASQIEWTYTGKAGMLVILVYMCKKCVWNQKSNFAIRKLLQSLC